MCGIVGYVGEKQALEVVVAGLRRLEYRGYDSAGVAVISEGRLEVRKKAGKLVGPYLVGELIGEGTQGKVKEAVHSETLHWRCIGR